MRWIGRKPRVRRQRGTGRFGTTAAILAAVMVLSTIWLAERALREEVPVARVIVLHAFSGLDDTLNDGLIPAFKEEWKARTGESLFFVTEYAGSRVIADRVRGGADVYVAILASELDARRLVPDVAVPEAWTNLPHRGVLARTPVVLHVHEGNPHGVRGFEALRSRGETEPGEDLKVLRTDPRRSGLGTWALLATYGAALRETRDRDAALGRLLALEDVSMPFAINARAAARCFRMGVGDVTFAYEQDLLADSSHPAAPGVVVRPRRTILCEPVVVVLRRNIPRTTQTVMDAFVAFLWSEKAQAVLRDHGFLPPDGVPDDPEIEDAFTLADLGGAEAAQRDILDRVLARPAHE